MADDSSYSKPITHRDPTYQVESGGNASLSSVNQQMTSTNTPDPTFSSSIKTPTSTSSSNKSDQSEYLSSVISLPPSTSHDNLKRSFNSLSTNGLNSTSMNDSPSVNASKNKDSRKFSQDRSISRFGSRGRKGGGSGSSSGSDDVSREEVGKGKQTERAQGVEQMDDHSEF